MIYYPQYCYDCGCSFVSESRHAQCWACGGSKTINCFSEFYKDLGSQGSQHGKEATGRTMVHR